MKKTFKLSYILTILILLFSYIPTYAVTQEGYVEATAGLIVRKNAGTTYSKITTLPNNAKVTINSTKDTTDLSTGCPSKKWHNITYNTTIGYVCSSYIKLIDTTPIISNLTDEEFEDYIENEGFPTSYWDKLKKLHKSHPNWVFKAVKAKYTWSNALSQENTLGRSLLQVNSTGVSNGLQGYLSTVSTAYNYATDKFKAYDGSTWFQANSQTISYYMDPRNFLTESGIFMFEDLKYYDSYQTSDVIKKVLYTDFYKNYINYYIEAASKYNVSPVYLAALSRQEVGLNSSTATSGKAGTYNNVDYNGYYNFYNIGASSGANPVYNGLAYSKNAGWTTPQKAIVGGAEWIVDGYINVGQYTQYFQKWNTSPEATTGIWHQYMTNVKALVSPATTTAASYNSMNIINEALVFSIPVYIGMPTSTSLPPTGNPNNWLSNLSVDETTVKDFSSQTTTYNLGTVNNDKTSIIISGKTINKYASIDGDGTIVLAEGTNKIPITVTAQNGSKKIYNITITREKSASTETNPDINDEITISNILTNLAVKNNDINIYGLSLGTTATTLGQNILKQNNNSIVKITNKSGTTKTDKLATGDKVTITSAGETKTYQVLIYGDINGDSSINAKDLLVIRKYLLKEKSLSGIFLDAAKLNKGSSVTAKDLLILRKYLLGTSKISQM